MATRAAQVAIFVTIRQKGSVGSLPRGTRQISVALPVADIVSVQSVVRKRPDGNSMPQTRSTSTGLFWES